MHKLLVIFLYLLFSQLSVFSATIIFDTAEKIVFNATGGTSYDLVTEHGSGGGNTESDPTEVYIPIKDLAGSQELHNVLGLDIPDINDGTATIAGTGTGPAINQTFSFKLDIDFGSDDSTIQYVYMAYYDSDADEYEIFKVLGSYTGDADSTELSVDLIEICDIHDCTALAGGNSNEVEDELYYIFSTTTAISTGTSDDYDTIYTGGAFLRTNMSTRVYDGSADSPTVTVSQGGIVTGDESLYINYSSSAIFSNHKEVLILTLAAPGVAQTYSSAIGAGSANTISDENEFPVVDDGANLQIKDLANNQNYNIAIAFLDKYQFSTMVTATQSGTPLEIAAFLKEQSCYFVSAGFGRPHYVLEYFRMIRDQYLLKSSVGRTFVEFYYGSAPKYVGTIYNSPALSLVVRSASYCLYFIMNFFWIFTLTILSLLYFSKFYLFKNLKRQ